MAQQQGNPSSGRQAEPATDRCPNCDRPLHFPADQVEAYCPSCGIFVEVLRPLGPSATEANPAEGDEARLRTAKLYLELDGILEGEPEEESAEPPTSVRAEAAVPEVEPEGELAEEGTEAPVEPVEIPAAGPSAVPSEPVMEQALAPEAAAPSVASTSAVTAAIATAHPQRWHRILFYAGSILVAFGGSGLALGSLLHDVFRVPVFGFAYDAFGDLNLSAVVFGAAFLLPGFVAMLVGARAGARPRRAAGG